MLNSKRVKVSKSGYRGVVTDGNGFVARMAINGKMTRLGVFATPEEASELYQHNLKLAQEAQKDKEEATKAA
jgi:hypothetical protein